MRQRRKLRLRKQQQIKSIHSHHHHYHHRRYPTAAAAAAKPLRQSSAHSNKNCKLKPSSGVKKRKRASQSPREQQRNVGRRSSKERPNVWREETLHAPLVLKYVGCRGGGSAQCDEALVASRRRAPRTSGVCPPAWPRYQWRCPAWI